MRRHSVVPCRFLLRQNVSARRGWAAERTALLGCFSLGSRLYQRFSCGRLSLGSRLLPVAALRQDSLPIPRFYSVVVVRLVVLLVCFLLDHACLFPLEKEAACGSLRFYSVGGRDRLLAFSLAFPVILICGFTSDSLVSLGRSRRGTSGVWVALYLPIRKEVPLWVGTSFCYRLLLSCVTAGSTLGLRAPDCAKGSSTLWTLFTLRRG